MSFDLPQDPSQLSYAQVREANARYEQYLPTSSAIGANFPQGSVCIPWSTSQPNWFDFSKSFVRLLVNTSYPRPLGSQLNPEVPSMGPGSPFLQIQGVAPAMHQAASLFSRCEVRCNGVTVSLLSDWVPQCEAAMKRILKTKANNDSFGYSNDYFDPQYHSRQARITMPTLDLGTFNQSNLCQSIYDLGFTYPPIDKKCVINLNAAGTTATITTDYPVGPNSQQSLIDYFRNGDIITVLEGATLAPQWRAYLRNVAITSAEVLTLTLTNCSGATGAAYDIGANGNPAQVFIERQQEQQISNTVELLWQPPLSIWHTSHMMPSSAYWELVLVPWPSSVYQGRAVETLAPGKVAGVDFGVTVQDVSLQLYTVAGPRIENLNFLIDLPYEINCQAQSVTVGKNSLLQQSWDVPSSTYFIMIALQSRNLNDSAVSSTKFTVNTPQNTQNANLQNSVTRLFVQFRSASLPPQKQELSYKAYERDQDPLLNAPASAGNDQFTLRWREYVQGTGLAGFSCEREIDWLNKGALHAFYVPADVSAQSTRLQTNLQFSEDLSQLANVLVFTVSRRAASVSIDAGRFTSVVIQDL